MGKRSEFERKPRDFYPTPYEAVVPLLSQLPAQVEFDEPCAADRALVEHLESDGHACTCATDTEPMNCRVHAIDLFDLVECRGDMFITNPPWDWKILNPLITHLSSMAPTWLLLNADLMHNKRMGPHMARCRRVVSVGRVKWIPDSKNTGMENCAWYLFGDEICETTFIGR